MESTMETNWRVELLEGQAESDRKYYAQLVQDHTAALARRYWEGYHDGYEAGKDAQNLGLDAQLKKFSAYIETLIRKSD